MAALVFLTPYFYYIPKTSLAAVIITASFMMVDVKIVKRIYKSKSTFTFCILRFGFRIITWFIILLLDSLAGHVSHRSLSFQSSSCTFPWIIVMFFLKHPSILFEAFSLKFFLLWYALWFFFPFSIHAQPILSSCFCNTIEYLAFHTCVEPNSWNVWGYPVS